MAIGRLYTEGMIGTLLRLLTIEATLPYCGYIDPLFVKLRYDRHDHLQPRVQPGRQPGQARGRGRAGVRHRPWPSRLCAAAYEAYQRLAGPPKRLLDAVAMPSSDDIVFDPPRMVAGVFRAPDLT